MKDEEQKEPSEREKTLAVAKDLVELALQSQKVLANASISVPHIEDVRLLVAMIDQVFHLYTERKVVSETESK